MMKNYKNSGRRKLRAARARKSCNAWTNHFFHVQMFLLSIIRTTLCFPNFIKRFNDGRDRFCLKKLSKVDRNVGLGSRVQRVIEKALWNLDFKDRQIKLDSKESGIKLQFQYCELTKWLLSDWRGCLTLSGCFLVFWKSNCKIIFITPKMAQQQNEPVQVNLNDECFVGFWNHSTNKFYSLPSPEIISTLSPQMKAKYNQLINKAMQISSNANNSAHDHDPQSQQQEEND